MQLLALLLLSSLTTSLSSAKSTLENTDDVLSLDILHVNDLHAHFEEVNENVGRCTTEQAEAKQCYGGVARMFTKTKEIVDAAEKKDNLLFFNAGDIYQGTIWYTLFGYEPVLEFNNLLNYTAMGLGNHDFDDGIDGLLPFVEQANYPVLAANIVEEGEQGRNSPNMY
jgi:2',3'-cyclic-nucleotide 2'-phosphodiesterase (5'-nucleotidase family)